MHLSEAQKPELEELLSSHYQNVFASRAPVRWLGTRETTATQAGSYQQGHGKKAAKLLTEEQMIEFRYLLELVGRQLESEAGLTD